jgi:predicted TIM-barrel fold metal-dependent hydrolase
MVDMVGADNLMFETDIPHSTCYFPNPVERVMDSLKSFEPALRDKLLAGNAARLYNIPI